MIPLGIIQVIESIYILGTLAIVTALVWFLGYHPYGEGRRLSWWRIAVRTIVVLGIIWGFLGLLSFFWEVLGYRGDEILICE
jgi:hypothetical protein